MKWLILLTIFSAFGQKAGDFYQDRKVEKWMLAGKHLIYLCEQQATLCINEATMEESINRNNIRKKYRDKDYLFFASLEQFENYDECRKMQYKSIYQKNDFNELCNY